MKGRQWRRAGINVCLLLHGVAQCWWLCCGKQVNLRFSYICMCVYPAGALGVVWLPVGREDMTKAKSCSSKPQTIIVNESDKQTASKACLRQQKNNIPRTGRTKAAIAAGTNENGELEHVTLCTEQLCELFGINAHRVALGLNFV